MKFDILLLEKAFAALESTHEAAVTEAHQYKSEIANIEKYMQLASIKAFEFTYYTSYEMLKSYLRMSEADPGNIDTKNFHDLICLGKERGLLSNSPDVWTHYHKQFIAAGADEYDELIAAGVFATITGFRKEVRYLIGKLKEEST